MKNLIDIINTDGSKNIIKIMNGLKVKQIAMEAVGYKESTNNSTMIGRWFGLDGVAWCGIFMSWCYDQAGFPLGKIGFIKGFAGCMTAVAHFKKTGEVNRIR